MSVPIRLTVVLTHPIQYYAPWFRHIHAHVPELALTVVHAIEPTAEQQGVGFDRAFQWDVPLTEGYRAVTVRSAKPGDRIDAGHFFGLDVKEIGSAIAPTRPDVVLINGWYSITLVRALQACRRMRVPTLYRGDTNLLSGPIGWRRALWSAKTRLLLRQFNGYLSTGQRSTEFLQAFGVPEYRIFNAPPAVDNEMFAASDASCEDREARAEARRAWSIPVDAFVPLFVGRLVDSKRPLDVIRAAATLAPGVTVMFVGSGPLEQPIRDEATRLGVDVKLAGFLNQTELGRAYAVADCLALPSDARETWGLVANEALAAGLPCVVSDAVGCAPDLIRSAETGFTYPVADVTALAAALDNIRRLKADGHTWRPACREVIARFTYATMTAGTVRAARSVLRHSPGLMLDDGDAPYRVIACCAQMFIPGGLERMTFHALRALRDRDVAAHAIVNSWEHFRITPLAEDAGATWSVGPDWHPLTRRGLTPLKVARMAIEVLRVSANLLSVSKRIRPTHVFLPEFKTVIRNSLALAWLRLRGVRVMVRLGNAPETGLMHRIIWRFLIDPFVDVFITNSEYTRRELLAHGIAAEKAVTIANVLSRASDSVTDDGADRIPGRVVFVGQIIPEKGLLLLLDAIADLRAAGIDATLDVVGDMVGWEAPRYAGYRARVRDRAAQPDLASAVRLLGWRDDVPVLMRTASIHCCPSLPEQREAFGNVVLEAKDAGLPSVVIPSGNLPDLVAHKQDGWVCARPDVEALVEGLRFFLTQPQVLAAAGAAARRSAEKFSQERFAAGWVCAAFPQQKAQAHAIP